MEKKNEENKKSSQPGRSTTRRNLFSSIINFSVSQGVKLNGNSGSSTVTIPPHTTTINSNLGIGSIGTTPTPTIAKEKKESLQVSKKTIKNEESISCNKTTGIGLNHHQNIHRHLITTTNTNTTTTTTTTTTNNNSQLIGQPPKTFSVLTALNELENSKLEKRNNHHHHHHHHHSSSVSTLALVSPVCNNLIGGGGGSGSGSGSGGIKSQEIHSPHHNNTNELQHIIKGMKYEDSSLSGGRKSHTLAPRPKPKTFIDKDHIHSISSSSSSPSGIKHGTSKSKERTPDWIWKIFQLAKNGQLDELKASLIGLDPTLIRHLADAKGNTLLHCAARGGHIMTLQWLVLILSTQIEAALNDQNQAGRNVILTTLKSGRLECFQWMVLHTSFGDKALVPTEGKWSLLHFASKYGNEGAVRWLCEQLLERQVRVDLRDSAGMTPLHVAAKSGHIGVSQELIRAGADPLYQTELGWRPSDLAFRHHHVECANYFIMAEAAGSLGKELHSILMDFTTLHQQQETLRTHFREVLRVGKWLMKERGDLIKKFAPSGSTSSPQVSSLLLGGTMNGVRLSELEHSLVLAEQGWKKVESNRVDSIFPLNGRGGEHDLPIQNIHSTTDLLQIRLFTSLARQDKNVTSGAMMSASSSEDESSLSTVTSGDEETSIDAHLKSCIRKTRTRQQQQHHSNIANGNDGIVSNIPFHRSTNTPWLLESEDSILSALSPPSRNSNHSSTSSSQHLPCLDLLRGATSTNTHLLSRTGPPGRNSSSSENSPSVIRTKMYETNDDDNVQPFSPIVPSSAAVLEVIEPLHTTTKKYGAESLPMNKAESILRRVSLSQSQSSSGYSISPSTMDASLSSSIKSELQLTSRTRRRSNRLHKDEESESHLSQIQHSTAELKTKFEEIYLAPDLIRGTHHHGARNVIPMNGRLIPSLTENTMASGIQSNSCSGLDEIYSSASFEGNHFAKFNSRKSHLTDGFLAVGPKGGNSSKAHISSTLSGPTKKTTKTTTTSEYLSSSSHPITTPSEQDLEHEFFLEEENSEIEKDSLVIPEQHGNSILPFISPYVSVSPSSAKKNYGTLLTILPLESSDIKTVAASTTTSFHVQQLQLHLQSTENRSQKLSEASTVNVVHLTNDSSSSSSTPIMPRSHSSVSISSTVVFPFNKTTWTTVDGGDVSTYMGSRLSPTPSETSRTESALAPPPSHTSEASKTESSHGQQHTDRDISRLSLLEGKIDDEEEDNTRRDSPEEEDKRGLERVLKMRREEKADDVDFDKNCLGSTRSRNVQETPCIIRQRLSTTPIHKTSIHHRVKKSSRRVTKPWYEIEGSDDEGSLLRVARARSSSSCHSTSSLSAPEESGSEDINFCDGDAEGHECDSTKCSRHNCPDFV